MRVLGGGGFSYPLSTGISISERSMFILVLPLIPCYSPNCKNLYHSNPHLEDCTTNSFYPFFWDLLLNVIHYIPMLNNMTFAFWKNWLVISDTKLQTKKFWKKKNELISFNAFLYQMLLFHSLQPRPKCCSFILKSHPGNECFLFLITSNNASHYMTPHFHSSAFCHALALIIKVKHFSEVFSKFKNFGEKLCENKRSYN